MTTIADRGAGAANTDDVVELILADHREFEELIRALRDRTEDRAARLGELADLLVAHAQAEEGVVYPSLEQRAPQDAEEVAHGEEEHAEGHVALLDLLRAVDADTDDFEDALEELSETVMHHVDEEERDVLNAARENVADDIRAQLGRSFRDRRAALLTTNPGNPENVERLVDTARRQGLFDD